MDIDRLLDLEPIEDCYKDSDYFNPVFLPRKINHRDNEIKTLVSYMRPILYNQKPKNCIVFGNSGAGKTTVLRKLFNSIEKEYNNTYCCYVNCNFNTSIRDIYLKIYEKVCKEKISNQSKAKKEIFNLIFDHLREKKKNILICLDDIVTHFRKKDINELFSQLLRSHEHEENYKVIDGLYPIVSHNNFRFQLTSQVLSVFPHNELKFNNYNKDQMFSILKERCDKGFCKKVITDEQIKIISNYCSLFSDLRGGLEILTTLGNMVNVNNDCKIRDDYVDFVINEHRICNISNC